MACVTCSRWCASSGRSTVFVSTCVSYVGIAARSMRQAPARVRDRPNLARVAFWRCDRRFVRVFEFGARGFVYGLFTPLFLK